MTHPAHWPPMGGATHDASPEWMGRLENLPDKNRVSGYESEGRINKRNRIELVDPA